MDVRRLAGGVAVSASAGGCLCTGRAEGKHDLLCEHILRGAFGQVGDAPEDVRHLLRERGRMVTGEVLPQAAPMTGPGGRWRPISELPEVSAAAHFAALAEAGRESCTGFCPVCAARDAAPETCANCGGLVEDSHRIEFAPGAFRAVTVLVHAGTGLEQCDGGETSAERRSEPEGER